MVGSGFRQGERRLLGRALFSRRSERWMSAAGNAPPYWSQDASALAAALGSGLHGLSSDRAAAQLALVGLNSVADAPRLNALWLLLRQFESPLVLILALAAALSLLLQEWVDAAIILVIVLG